MNGWDIKLTDDEVDMLMICAVRYAMGRQTYMPSEIQRIVLDHITELNGHTLAVLQQECDFQARWSLWGDDKTGWMILAAAVDREIERRTHE